FTLPCATRYSPSFPTRPSSDLTGRIQLGASETQDVGPAEIPIVGDKADPGAPTYATFSPLLRYEPIPTGWTVIQVVDRAGRVTRDRKSTRLNSSHVKISYAVFC